MENKFQELDDDKSGTFHKHERVHESCTKKDGTSAEYKRVTRVDHFESVKNICQLALHSGNQYLKHRTYVDNLSSVFPFLKEAYNGKALQGLMA